MLEIYRTSTDTSLGHGKEVIRFWCPWLHFQGHYIVNEKWTLSHESTNGIWKTSTDTSLGWEKEVIRLWWPWLHFQGHTDTLKLNFWQNKACVHSISWFNVTPALWNFCYIPMQTCGEVYCFHIVSPSTGPPVRYTLVFPNILETLVSADNLISISCIYIRKSKD